MTHPDLSTEQQTLDSKLQQIIRDILRLENRDRHAGADEHTSDARTILFQK